MEIKNEIDFNGMCIYDTQQNAIKYSAKSNIFIPQWNKEVFFSGRTMDESPVLPNSKMSMYCFYYQTEMSIILKNRNGLEEKKTKSRFIFVLSYTQEDMPI